jgi:DNA polymerase I-like protein with 3'-5' exonuclease and polymerase domains
LRKTAPGQLPLFVPDSDWKSPARLPTIPSGLVVALDTETRDDGLSQERGPGWVTQSGYIVGFSLAWQHHAVYIPLRHSDSENWDVGEAMAWLQDVVSRSRRVVLHNQQYDEGWLGTENITLPEGGTDDTQSMAVMLDENHDSYRLDDCCRRAGIPGKDEQALREAAAAYGVDPKKELWRLPARFVGPYAEQDAQATLALREHYLPQLVREGLEEAYKLEMDLVPMAIAMRRRGIRVDESAADRVQRMLREQRAQVLDETRRQLLWPQLTMEHINSPQHLMRAFDQQGIEYPRTPKTKVGQFTADWLEAQDHWLPAAVRQARQLNDLAEKFIGTYILDNLHVGRVHSEIHLLRDETGGTRSYRLSYSNPPLQQMPARHPILAPLMRSIFLPERGELWGAADYSQQEPRVAVHLASICRVAGAAEAVAYYSQKNDADFHQMVADLTGLSRSQSKIINLGLMYGMGLPKLARSLGVSLEQAQEILEQYNERMPWVAELTKFCTQRADVRGFIKLLDGARCRFDHWEPTGNGRDTEFVRPMRRDAADAFAPWRGRRLRRADTRKAMNRAVQGGSARQTKIAMRDCWREGILPMLQLHDELDFSIGDPMLGMRASQIMIDAVKLNVPMKVDLQYGHSWGQASQELKGVEPISYEEMRRAGPTLSNKEILALRA